MSVWTRHCCSKFNFVGARTCRRLSSGPHFSPVAEAIPRSGIRDIMDMAWAIERQGKRVFHLEVGQPMFSPPQLSLDRVTEAVNDVPFQRYIPNGGLIQLRESVANYYNTRFGKLYESFGPDNVVISHGAVGAIATAFMSTIEHGDEVLCPNPGWPNYEMAVNLFGGIPRNYDLDPNNGWRLDIDSIRRAITPKTKVIILCTPSNPTGTCLTKLELTELIGIAKENSLFIVSDEIYSQVYFGSDDSEADQRAESCSILDCAETLDFDSTIVVSGVSKAYSMTGFRVGWLLGSKKLVDLSTKLQEAFLSCGVPFSQAAAITAIDECLKPNDTFVRDCVAQYKERRDSAIAIMSEHDSLVEYTPAGAFYCLIPIKAWLERNGEWLRANALDTPHTEIFCHQLLQDHQVAVSPGETFGTNAEQHIRVSLAQDQDTVEEGMRRLCRFITDEEKVTNWVRI